MKIIRKKLFQLIYKRKQSLRVCAISDLHGTLPKIKKSDILLIAGDISPLEIQFNIPKMKEWLIGEFKTWVENLPVDKVFLVAGNHDSVFERCDIKTLGIENNKLKYLHNESTEYVDVFGKIWTIFGTPYCHIFGNWPFMRTEEYMTDKFKEIPNNVDIIISHDPPYGIGQVDQILDEPMWGNHIRRPLGNEPLSDKLWKIKFKLLVCGHIHSGDHYPCIYNGGKVVNVSILNERYKHVNKPFYTRLKCTN